MEKRKTIIFTGIALVFFSFLFIKGKRDKIRPMVERNAEVDINLGEYLLKKDVQYIIHFDKQLGNRDFYMLADSDDAKVTLISPRGEKSTPQKREEYFKKYRKEFKILKPIDTYIKVILHKDDSKVNIYLTNKKN